MTLSHNKTMTVNQLAVSLHNQGSEAGGKLQMTNFRNKIHVGRNRQMLTSYVSKTNKSTKAATINN